MVLKYEPLAKCFQELRSQNPPAPVIGLTPRGVRFSQNLAKELAVLPRIILVCGRYEGFDERVLPEFDLQLSIGDYVLTGGEIAAMAVVDAISRMIHGTVGRMESVEQDSFFEGQLDHPQFTRPSSVSGGQVPQILQDGNHAKIEDWRRERAFVLTAMKRPDVFARLDISDEDKERIQRAVQGTDVPDGPNCKMNL